MNPLRTLAAAWRELPRVLPLMRNPAVPTAAKVSAAVAAAFIISPLDIFGDIPILGFVDDVALLGFLVHLFVSYSERKLERARIVERNITPVRATSGSVTVR